MCRSFKAALEWKEANNPLVILEGRHSLRVRGIGLDRRQAEGVDLSSLGAARGLYTEVQVLCFDCGLPWLAVELMGYSWWMDCFYCTTTTYY